MKRFRVSLFQPCYYYAEVEVEAENEQEATSIAMSEEGNDWSDGDYGDVEISEVRELEPRKETQDEVQEAEGRDNRSPAEKD